MCLLHLLVALGYVEDIYNDLCHDLMYSLLTVDKFSIRSREHMKTAIVSRAKYLVE